MASTKIDKTVQFLHALLWCLKRSESAYRMYLQNGKTFLYANVIRGANEDIVLLVQNNMDLIPSELMDDFTAIYEHLEIWRLRWYELEETSTPDLDDEFIFQNKHSFPREANERIESFYHSLTVEK